jgi:hypothetical protein
MMRPRPRVALTAIKLEVPMYRSHDSFDNSLRQQTPDRSGRQGSAIRAGAKRLNAKLKDANGAVRVSAGEHVT